MHPEHLPSIARQHRDRLQAEAEVHRQSRISGRGRRRGRRSSVARTRGLHIPRDGLLPAMS